MDNKVIDGIFRQVEKEPYARKLGIRLIEAEPGRALVELPSTTDMENIHGMTHGGAIFSLIDEAFQISCNTHGTIAVALSVTLTYHQPPNPGEALRAESKEVHRSRKTGTYIIQVTGEQGALIASCQALAYRKGIPLPFLEEEEGETAR